MDKQQEYVLRAIEERDISFIRLWFTDVSGQLKSVAIAPSDGGRSGLPTPRLITRIPAAFIAATSFSFFEK